MIVEVLKAQANLKAAIRRRGWKLVEFKQVNGNYQLIVQMPASLADDKEKLHDFRTYWGYIAFATRQVNEKVSEVMFYTF